MNEIMTVIVKAIISVVVVAISVYLIPFIKTLLNRLKDDQIKKIILDAVWAAQQTLVDNDDKKNYVLGVVSDWLIKHKIDISATEIDMLIESTVLEMKTETR